MRNDEVVEEFFNGATEGKSGNLFIEDDILYSYGFHFPLVVRTKSDDQYVMNADKYSVTTSQHQSLCWRHNPIMTSFRMLDMVFTSFSAGKLSKGEIKIIDAERNRKDRTGYRHIKTDSVISIGKYHELSKKEKEEYTPYYETRPGGCILKYKDRYLLASMGERQYFISELPRPVKTVEEGFELLKPNEVKDRDYKRQGEWFFVELPIEEKEVKKAWTSLESKFVLPQDNDRSNPHTCTRGGFIADLAFSKPIEGLKANQIIVGGQVSHWEHRQLKLNVISRGEWKLFMAYKNTALHSWSAGRLGIGID